MDRWDQTNSFVIQLAKLMMMYLIKDTVNYERFCKEADALLEKWVN